MITGAAPVAAVTSSTADSTRDATRKRSWPKSKVPGKLPRNRPHVPAPPLGRKLGVHQQRPVNTVVPARRQAPGPLTGSPVAAA